MKPRGERPRGEYEDKIHALTRAQRDAFEWLCMQRQPHTSPRVLAKLAELGLVEARKRVLGGGLPVTIIEHDVPTAVHVAWARLSAWEEDGE